MAKPKPAVSQFAALADELGALEKEMAPFAQKLARIDALRKALREAAKDQAAANMPWTVYGTHFLAILGPRAAERIINFPALIKRIGAGRFSRFAKCTLKDLEANVDPATVAAVVTTDATGSRSLKTFERGTPE